jgi:hypothetical protein
VQESSEKSFIVPYIPTRLTKPKEITMSMGTESCKGTWDHADHLLFMDAIKYWCDGSPGCVEAKKNALLSVLERGTVKYRRRDGKTFKDSVYELQANDQLLVGRESFQKWALSVSDEEESRSLQNNMALSDRSEGAYQNIIGALLDVVLGDSPSGKPHSLFKSQSSLIDALLAHHGDKDGISQRTLDGKFAKSKRHLKGS